MFTQWMKEQGSTVLPETNLSWILKDECLPAGAFANPVKHGMFKDTEAWN